MFTGTVLVNNLRKSLFADATFARYQHRKVGTETCTAISMARFNAESIANNPKTLFNTLCFR